MTDTATALRFGNDSLFLKGKRKQQPPPRPTQCAAGMQMGGVCYSSGKHDTRVQLLKAGGGGDLGSSGPWAAAR